MSAAYAPQLLSRGALKREDDRVQDPTGCTAVTQHTGEPVPARWPDRVRLAAHAHATRLESATVGRFWARLLEVEFVDRAVALAAKAVVSFFPLLIVAAACHHRRPVAPSWTRIAAQVRRQRRGLLDHAAAPSPPRTRREPPPVCSEACWSVAYAVSFTTALQRVYLRAWRRPAGGGVRNKGRGAMWVAGVLVLLVLLASLRRIVAGPAGHRHRGGTRSRQPPSWPGGGLPD